MNALEGLSALVTGGSRGIGPYIAHALAHEGVHVAITARSRERLEGVAASIERLGVRAVALPADLTDAAERVQVVAQTVEAFGRVDLLVNNAGIEVEGRFVSLEPHAISRAVELNFIAAVALARLVLPGMLERGTGHIVNMSSLAGKKGAPYDAVYSGTKAALVEWTHALRVEVRLRGVGLSVICPGYVRRVGMFARFGIPAPRSLGSCTPEQVAAAVVRAIRRNRAEVIVNPLPVRPLLALGALGPGLADRLLDLLGITAFQRRKVGADSERNGHAG